MVKLQIFLILLLSFLWSYSIYGQYDSIPSQDHDTSNYYAIYGAHINIDSIVISATRTGLNIDDFISLIMNDTSFHNAFSRIRSLSYSFSNKIYFLDRRNSIKASYKGHHKQHYTNNCRYMEVMNNKVSGRFYKRNKPRFYTAKLYEKLFYTNDTICTFTGTSQYSKNTSKTNQRINELKTLIFSPGEAVNIPLIGSKLAIFSKKMIPYYNYSITYELYQDSISCFVFNISLKEEHIAHKNKTVIKYLQTFIKKDNLQIIARKYNLAYDNLFYDFDVDIEIQLKKIETGYVPLLVKYNGKWDIIGKKPENAVFEINFDYKNI